jgi:aspartate ammonia-lyase
MPHIGYAKAAELSKQSVKEGVLVRDMVKRDKLLPADEIDDVLQSVRLSDLLLQESQVRERVGLTEPAGAGGRLALPVLDR